MDRLKPLRDYSPPQFTLDPEAGRAVAARAQDWDRFSHISTR